MLAPPSAVQLPTLAADIRVGGAAAARGAVAKGADAKGADAKGAAAANDAAPVGAANGVDAIWVIFVVAPDVAAEVAAEVAALAAVVRIAPVGAVS